MKRPTLLLLALLIWQPVLAEPALTADPWWQSGQRALRERLAVTVNDRPARNVIIFIGDGMGISTLTAGRIFAGQQLGLSGEGYALAFEKFPHTALIKTYNADSQVPDSAGTASAMATGVKARIGTLGLGAGQSAQACFGPQTDFPRSLVSLAEERGLATGLVSTTRITHATPAAFYSHAPDRTWEDDSAVPDEARQRGCRDIARQLAEYADGDGIDLILGGGRANFLPNDAGGQRTDGRNLAADWRSAGPDRHFVDNVQALRGLSAKTGQVMGLLSASHMAYEADRDDGVEPSLTEMTRIAIEHLRQNDKGYFLMVEGGRIDHAHHATNAYRALADTVAFADAVATAIALTDPSDTLILVTADHSHVFTMAGYAPLGNPILGLARDRIEVDGKPVTRLRRADDGKPYTTLGYHNGPHGRADDDALQEARVLDPDYRQQSAIAMSSETHGGEDVALFAQGPRAHLVGGVLEQHVIFHLIVHAFDWQLEQSRQAQPDH